MTPPPSCAGLDVVASKRSLPKIPFAGQWWVEGSPGVEYGLRLSNACPFRVLAVVSVDGLDVLSGSPASFQSSGYVVEPGGSAWIPGWRKSQDRVAAFYFSSPSDSYAARTKQGADVGVIGAAFFQERRQEAPAPAPYASLEKPRQGMPSDAAKSLGAAPSAPVPPGSATERAAPSFAAPSQEPSLGTGHGRSIDNSVSTTSFERAPAPFSTLALRYESTRRLVEMGAIRREPLGPNPFPAESGQGFVPDPPQR